MATVSGFLLAYCTLQLTGLLLDWLRLLAVLLRIISFLKPLSFEGQQSLDMRLEEFENIGRCFHRRYLAKCFELDFFNAAFIVVPVDSSCVNLGDIDRRHFYQSFGESFDIRWRGI